MKRKFINKKNFFLPLASSLFFSILLISSVAIAISQGYATDDTSLKAGMAVKLSDDSSADTPKVERANIDDAKKFVGITTQVEENSVTIASSNQSVYVESEGEVRAYVSDLDGPVKQGDQLTLSPLRGILTKASNQSHAYLGVALEDFAYNGAETHEIKTADGTKIVSINTIKFTLDAKNIGSEGKVDSSLERLGKAIVGKEVSEIRVVIALVIFLVVLFAEGSIIYGAISSAITSLGRNPLARKAIKRELLQISLVALAVLFIGLAAVYLVLWA